VAVLVVVVPEAAGKHQPDNRKSDFFTIYMTQVQDGIIVLYLCFLLFRDKSGVFPDTKILFHEVSKSNNPHICSPDYISPLLVKMYRTTYIEVGV
jgi:hypothetical protein